MKHLWTRVSMPSAYDTPRKSEYRYGGVAERKAAEIEDKTLPLSYRRRGKKKKGRGDPEEREQRWVIAVMQ